MSPGSAVDQVKSRLLKLRRSSTFGKLRKRLSVDAKELSESTSQKEIFVGSNRRTVSVECDHLNYF